MHQEPPGGRGDGAVDGPIPPDEADVELPGLLPSVDAHLNELVDEAARQSFPASDPPALLFEREARGSFIAVFGPPRENSSNGGAGLRLSLGRRIAEGAQSSELVAAAPNVSRRRDRQRDVRLCGGPGRYLLLPARDEPSGFDTPPKPITRGGQSR